MTQHPYDERPRPYDRIRQTHAVRRRAEPDLLPGSRERGVGESSRECAFVAADGVGFTERAPKCARQVCAALEAGLGLAPETALDDRRL